MRNGGMGNSVGLMYAPVASPKKFAKQTETEAVVRAATVLGFIDLALKGFPRTIIWVF